MIFLFFSNKTYNVSPETGYGGGHTMAFKKGWFMFDEDNAGEVSHWKVDGVNMIVDGENYQIKPEYTFKHPIKAELAFLRLKMLEMKNSSFDFFMPRAFEKIQNRYNELREKHPEYVL